MVKEGGKLITRSATDPDRPTPIATDGAGAAGQKEEPSSVGSVPEDDIVLQGDL
jgi:hypothetical protein